MAKRSGSRKAAAPAGRAARAAPEAPAAPGGIGEVVDKLKREAAPAMAKALNLDSAEAVEAALNAGLELLLAGRAVLRSLPLPPEAREHLDRAEGEALRAARMAVKGVDAAGLSGARRGATRVPVDFKQDRSAKQSKTKGRR